MNGDVSADRAGPCDLLTLEDEACGAALMAAPGIGQATLDSVVNNCGTLRRAYEFIVSGESIADLGAETACSPEALAKASNYLKRVDLDVLHRSLRRIGARVLARGIPPYPEGLSEVEGSPYLLLVAGDPALLQRDAIAIVGTRRATATGIASAERLGCELAQAGVVVVSGLALGIDAGAHRGACAGSGQDALLAAGVLGCGLDVVYPRQNRYLYETLLDGGVLVSEFGLGVAPERWRFPTRNRTIAALTRGVVVVEAFATGGALSTAAAAREMGREVMVVPGSVENPAARGTFELLRDGATPVAVAADIFFAAGLVSGVTGRGEIPDTDGRGADPGARGLTGRLAELLSDGARHSVFDLANLARVEPSAVVAAIRPLVASGWAERAGEGVFSRSGRVEAV